LILKELDPFAAHDKFSLAGRRAEEQMAHYLKRFFGSSSDVDVLNGLRIELRGEVAQIDHLILHPCGITIVESKSVAGSVQIKDDGQWIRWFNKQPQGMRSAVTQARMQGMMLRELLVSTVKQKGAFDKLEFDLLVAISDSGTIQWPSTGPLPEICKADQIPDKILARLEARWGHEPAFSLSNRRATAAFLKLVHRPTPLGPAAAPEEPHSLHRPAVVKPSVEAASALLSKACKHCNSSNVDVQYGKFGYYLACTACEKNTGIKFSCPSCGGEGRIRKQGKEFFAECKGCDASALYHTSV
jgi:hypothetical protein